jgi:hypothetical protein
MRASAQVTAPGAVTSMIVAMSTRPNRQNRLGGLDRLHNVEPVLVKEERVFAEQVVELCDHGTN